MTVPTFPRRWGELLTLASLLLVLTTTLVTGSGNVPCRRDSLCGYGTRCDNVTSQCVCLSGNTNLTKKEGYPFSVFYCLGQGVTDCGDQLCGYRAECDRASCRCSFSSDGLKGIEDRSPSLRYCVESCAEGSSSCPDNTTCTEYPGDLLYNCYCSAGATLSSTGQCLGNGTTNTVKSSVHDTTDSASSTKRNATTSPVESTIHDITESTSPTQANLSESGVKHGDLEHDSTPLVIGLTAGIGGAVLLAVVVMFVAALALKHRRLKAGVNGVLENELSTEFNCPYENAVSLSSPGVNIPSSPAVPTVDRPSLDDPANNRPTTYVNVSGPSQSPYENVTSGLYQSANTPDTSESNLYTTLRQT